MFALASSFRRAPLVFALAIAAVGVLASAGAVAQQAQPAAPAPAAPAAPRPAQTQPAPQAQPQQRQPQQQRQAQPRQQPPASVPTRIPPPGPAEVPLFPARDYTDPRTRLTLNVPAGWLVIEVPEAPEGTLGQMFIEGPGLPPPNCGITIVRPQQPARVTQAQLNRVLADQRSINGVRGNLAQEGRRVVSIRGIAQGGIGGIAAEVLIPGNALQPDVTTFVTFFEQVGRRYSINCNVLTNDLDSMRNDIQSIIRSVRFPT